MWNSLGNSIKITSLHTSVMNAKGKITSATVTTGCEALIIDENSLTFENHDFSMNFAN